METLLQTDVTQDKSYFVAFQPEYKEMITATAKYFGYENNLAQAAKNLLTVGYKIYLENPNQYLKILNS